MEPRKKPWRYRLHCWWRRNCSSVLKCAIVVVVIVGVGVLFNCELNLRAAKAEQILQTALAEKDAEIANRDAEIVEKDAKIEAMEAEMRKTAARAIILDKNGVRTDRMREIYHDPYSEFPGSVETDAEFREWCQENYPEAVLPSNDWTAEEVLVLWTEKPEIWGVWKDVEHLSERSYFVWTPDWEHCFYLDMDKPILPADYETGEHQELISGWLVMDGVRIKMIDTETYDIDDPYEMLRQYQTGEWDGETRRSHDGATTVEVSWRGTLEYTYEAWKYDATTDPLELAYQGYAAEPWWQRDGLSEELVTALGRNHNYKAWEDEAQTWAYEWLWGGGWDFYVDLPGGISAGVDGLGEVYEVSATQQGTFFATSMGIWLYKGGKLVDSWDRPVADDDDLDFFATFQQPKTSEEIAQLSATAPPVENPEDTPRLSEREQAQQYADAYAECLAIGLISEEDRAYFYTGEDLLALRKGGVIEEFFDPVPEAGRLTSRQPSRGLKDGRLIYWSGYNLPQIITEDVLAVDFTSVALIEKADGVYAVVYGQNCYGAQYLGVGPMEYYQRLNALLDRAWVR